MSNASYVFDSLNCPGEHTTLFDNNFMNNYQYLYWTHKNYYYSIKDLVAQNIYPIITIKKIKKVLTRGNQFTTSYTRQSNT